MFSHKGAVWRKTEPFFVPKLWHLTEPDLVLYFHYACIHARFLTTNKIFLFLFHGNKTFEWCDALQFSSVNWTSKCWPGPKRSIVVTEIYSKFAKRLIQIAGPKNIQHNVMIMMILDHIGQRLEGNGKF